MFIDASALTALVAGEEGALEFLRRMEEAALRLTSPIAVWEALVAVARLLELPIDEARSEVEGFLATMQVECIAIDLPIGIAAAKAFGRYGKGRHPAKLNLGDCFAYACARHHRLKLLYKGDDFSLTDIETA